MGMAPTRTPLPWAAGPHGAGTGLHWVPVEKVTRHLWASSWILLITRDRKLAQAQLAPLTDSPGGTGCRAGGQCLSPPRPARWPWSYAARGPPGSSPSRPRAYVSPTEDLLRPRSLCSWAGGLCHGRERGQTGGEGEAEESSCLASHCPWLCPARLQIRRRLYPVAIGWVRSPRSAQGPSASL